MALSARIGADFSEFTAAIDKVEVKVKTASEIAKNAGRDFDRLVASFDGTKVQRDAQLMVTAIEKLGGAGKLTAAEQAKVNTQVQEAIAKYHALGQQAPPAMQALADATKQAAVHQQSFTDSVLATTVGFVTAQAALAVFHAGYSALKAVLLGSVQAASEEEIALTKLRTALIQQGTAAPSVIAAYEGLARQYERTTVFSDHLLQSTMGTLAVVGGVMPRDMDTALRAVTNLASAFGGEQGLDKATLAVAKAAEGNITGLKRMGVVVDENKYKTEGFSAVLDAINAKFGGQAQALAETYTGRLTQMANAWDAVKEGIGHAIVQNRTVLETIASVTGAVQGNTADLAKNAEVMNLVSDATILLVRGFGLAGSAADLAQLTFQSLRIATEQTLAATANLAIGFLDTFVRVQNLQKFVNPSAWTSGSQQATKDAAAASAWLKGMVKGLDADSLDAIDDSIKYGNALQGLSAKAAALAAQLETTRGKVSALKEGTDSGTDAWNRHTVAVGKVATETEKYAEALVRNSQAASETVEAMRKWEWEVNREVNKALRGTVKEMNDATVATFKLSSALADSVPSAVRDASAALSVFAPAVAKVQTAFEGVYQGGVKISDGSFQARFRAMGAAVADVFRNINSTAGQVAQIATGTMNVWFDTTVTGAQKTAQKMVAAFAGAAAIIGQLFGGSKAGTWAASALGGAAAGAGIGFMFGNVLGAGIGAAIGGIAGLIAGMAATAKSARDADAAATAQIGQLQKQLLTTYGSLTEVDKATKTLGIDLVGAWGDKSQAGLKHFNALLDVFNAKLALSPTWDKASALMEEYKIDINNAGQAIQQLMVTESARALINDWQQWKSLIGDDTAAMEVFAKAAAAQFSTLVQQSAAFGSAIPENMRPMLEFLAASGLLLDANGKAITDIAGITFGTAVQTEQEKLVASLDRLTEALKQLSGVWTSGEAGIQSARAAQIGGLNAEGLPMDYAGAQAAGGDYWVTRPTLFLAGEAGPERATFRPGGGGSSQPIVITVISTLDGREVARNQVRYLPNQLTLAGL